MEAIRSLRDVSRSFGTGAARQKNEWLAEIAAAGRLSRGDLRSLGETLAFMRAYPDDPQVLRRVQRLIPRLPRANNVYAYSYGVVLRLLRLASTRLEIEWDELEDDKALLDALDLLVLPGESQGLEDTSLSLRDWFLANRPTSGGGDLKLLVDLIESSALTPAERVFLFENADLPLRYEGPGTNEIDLGKEAVHYQKKDLERSRFPLAPRVRTPLRRTSRGGQSWIDAALHALCARDLEIYPLIYANPDDVFVAHCGRGLSIVLIGVRPEWRSPLESLYFFLPLKNGVPVAYGPASVCCGCCEFGVNLFAEFRGVETRTLFAQIMRVLHHRLGADYFLLTRYAMGEDNDDALRSGAFWFYRKLGFKPTNPHVDELAGGEEARMAAEPGYRCDLRTLRRLSRTEAFLDLSGGKRRPLDFGRLGLAESRLIARSFDGDRRLARRSCSARAAKQLAMDPDGRALQTLAPLLSLIGDLPRWSRRDRSALARFLRLKEAPSEARAARLLARHARFEQALHGIAAGS